MSLQRYHSVFLYVCLIAIAAESATGMNIERSSLLQTHATSSSPSESDKTITPSGPTAIEDLIESDKFIIIEDAFNKSSFGTYHNPEIKSQDNNTSSEVSETVGQPLNKTFNSEVKIPEKVGHKIDNRDEYQTTESTTEVTFDDTFLKELSAQYIQQQLYIENETERIASTANFELEITTLKVPNLTLPLIQKEHAGYHQDNITNLTLHNDTNLSKEKLTGVFEENDKLNSTEHSSVELTNDSNISSDVVNIEMNDAAVTETTLDKLINTSLELQEGSTTNITSSDDLNDSSDESNSTSSDYYSDEENIIPMPPVPLPCIGRTCVRKCCSEDKLFSFTSPVMGCVDPESGDLQWAVPKFKDKYGYHVEPLEEPEISYGDLDCEKGSIDGHFYLLANGDAYNSEMEKEYSPESYCMEVIKYDESTTKLSFLTCIEPAVESKHYLFRKYTMPVLLVISSVALMVLITCYLLVPELRKDMQTKCRLSHASCLLVSDLCILATLVTPWDIPYGPCVAIGFTVHISLIAAFLWLTVLCYDIRRYFRDSNLGRTRLGMRGMDQFYFHCYCAFGWGGALLVAIVSLTLQFLPEDSLSPWVVRPEYAKTRCFIHDANPNMLYYYIGIIGASFVANVLYLGHTCFLLYKQGVAFTFLRRNQNKAPEDDRSRRESSPDSVFSQDESSSSTFSGRIQRLVSWEYVFSKTSVGARKDSDVGSVQTQTSVETDVTDVSLDSKRSLSSISEPSSTSLAEDALDEAFQITEEEKREKKKQLKKCNVNNMKGTDFRCHSSRDYKSEFWQRFQLFVLMALHWITDVLSYFIPPREIWVVADIINVLQGLFLLVMFLQSRQSRTRVRQQIHKLCRPKDKWRP